ncbi:MAG: hypothetical protein KME16_13595 [Scytolyngbya sp. HA4215-MV1]|nr:hypothetical protein [Scytolyngbya sp. HA4215-MV1]
MALISVDEANEYLTECILCNQRLSDPIYAMSAFEEPWGYSDAAMHWDCFASWELRQEFANLYFQEQVDWFNGNSYWKILKRTEDICVAYGKAAKQVEVILRQSGSSFRVSKEKWDKWLENEWMANPNHEIERAALKQSLSLLKTVKI